MEPVSTVAIAAATLVAKAAEHLGEKIWDKFTEDVADKAGEQLTATGWDALSRMAGRVRGWFRRHEDKDGLKAVETVAVAPDSKVAVDRLAESLKVALAADPDLEKDLRGYIQAAEQGNGDVATFTVQAWGNAKIGKVVQVNEMKANEIKF